MTASAPRYLSALVPWAMLGLALATVTVPVAATAGEASPLEATEGAVRAAPPGAPVLAGYLTLHNGGATAVTVVGAESPDFERVEIHRTELRDGVARMVPVDRLRIGPGETLRLEPGGMHLMLMRPRRHLSPGEKVRVTLHLEPAGTLAVSLPVRRVGTGGQGHRGHREHSMH